MDQFLNAIPWVVLLVVFIGEKLTQLGLSRALAQALQRAQTIPIPAPAPHPVPPAAPPATLPAPPKAVPAAAAVVLDQGLIAFVKKQEGFSAKATWDYKQYTNGYGTKALSADEVITEAEAERRLAVELGHALAAVQGLVPANTPVGVEQGLTDAAYNLGTGWMKAGLGAAVKAGNWAAAKEHLLQYNHAGGQVLDGLTKRRQAEVHMFDNPL